MNSAARLAAWTFALLAAGCALRAPSPGTFSFAVLGDTPYSERETGAYLEMLRHIDAEPVAFAIHIGDFKGGSNAPCTDEIFLRRKREFDALAHPLVFTPGDNEWVDCRRKSNGGMDPLERLARLRAIFFSTPRALGREPMPTEMQDACIAPVLPDCGCAAHPENRQWTRSGVRFVTLDIPGSDSGVGFDAAGDREARCRDEANRQWLERAIAAARLEGARALVIAFQADPWYSKKPVYEAFLAQVRDGARRLARPVLLVHGDTHIYRVDQPFTDAAGQALPGITRVETFGSPFVGWVKVTVAPDRPDPFTFEPRFEGF